MRRALVAGPPSPENPPVAPRVGNDGAAAGDRGDDSGRVDFADALVIEVGKIDVALSVDRQADRVVQFGAGGRPAVAGESSGGDSGRAAARVVGEDSVGVHFAYAIQAAVGEIVISRGVHHHVPRTEDRRGTGQPAFGLVDAGGWGAAARDGLREVRRQHFADAGVCVIGNINIAGGIHGDPVGRIQLSVLPRPSIAGRSRDSRAGDGGDDARLGMAENGGEGQGREVSQ